MLRPGPKQQHKRRAAAHRCLAAESGSHWTKLGSNGKKGQRLTRRRRKIGGAASATRSSQRQAARSSTGLSLGINSFVAPNRKGAEGTKGAASSGSQARRKISINPGLNTCARKAKQAMEEKQGRLRHEQGDRSPGRLWRSNWLHECANLKIHLAGERQMCTTMKVGRRPRGVATP